MNGMHSLPKYDPTPRGCSINALAVFNGERMSNRDYSSEPHFVEACKKVDIPATPRQASRFRNEKGLAYMGR